ncbi:MAG TPA: winged helix-turn-helix domain-containing protein, partial [bacterium]|nr:winged helix-turn-helix domain-containing protein [bacterium]
MVDAQGIQRQRMNTILRAVLETPRATRGALSARLGLSPSSIVKYAKVLIDNGLMRETDREESTGGRPSTVLELNPDAGLVVAVVLDATTVHGCLMDVSGRLLVERDAPSRQGISRDELLAVISQLIDPLLAAAREDGRRILGVGIG